MTKFEHLETEKTTNNKLTILTITKLTDIFLIYPNVIFTVMSLGLIAVIVTFLFIGVINMNKENNPSMNHLQKNASTPIIPTPEHVLKISIGNRWYPDDQKMLLSTLEGYWRDAQNVVPKVLPGLTAHKIKGIIAPHAGYQYSGEIAAQAFYAIKPRSTEYKRVLVLGPSHYYPLNNQIAVPDTEHHQYYQTPLGYIPLDTQFIQQLIKKLTNTGPKGKNYFAQTDAPFLKEHSVDNEIPLVQYALASMDTPSPMPTLAEFSLVPIIVGQMDLNAIKDIAKALYLLIDEQTLIVVSSDFTHYGESFGFVPFENNIEENLRKLDATSLTAIENLDVENFFALRQSAAATVCGHIPITLLLELGALDQQEKKSPTKVTTVRYDTSGKLTGDFSHSVSYASVIFSGSWHGQNQRLSAISTTSTTSTQRFTTSKIHNMELTGAEKENLLKVSRFVLENYVSKNKTFTMDNIAKELAMPIGPNLKAHRGGFVTLKKHGELRGCIGEILPERPLIEVVIKRTIDAAVNDNRFSPVVPEEINNISIEISALTPPIPVKSYNEIEIGKHGILLRKGWGGAVFLPQVAPEQGWDLPTTLTHLSLKAGLGPNDWREDTNFQVFEAIVFGETD
ncbi:MAG: AmmeMemoRadiSam system protein B [Oligoflexia bacterium]|nr:AmmeMemoRadiSam system protein B [Oligoflexia bacterium]